MLTFHITVICFHLGSRNLRRLLPFFQEAEGDEDEWDGEDQGNASVKVMCRLCCFGENEGSTKAAKMIPCKLCNKKYHRNCLKSWGEHRGNTKFSFLLSLQHLFILVHHLID